MLNTWPYEQTEVLIALWSEDLDLPSSVFGIYPWVSSRLKHGDDNRGSRAIRRHFDSRCEVTLSIGHFGKYHNTLCLSLQIWHKHCFCFLLGPL